MPRQHKANSRNSNLSSRLNAREGKKGNAEENTLETPGKYEETQMAAAAEAQAAADAAVDEAAARPQHRRGRYRSTTRRPRTTQGETFSFRIRERICQTHLDVHGILRERVNRARGRQGAAASYEGLAAEVRAVAGARAYVAQATTAQRPARLTEVRRALMDLAASAILLAEVADRPDEELPRGERSRARQWFTPDFMMSEAC